MTPQQALPILRALADGVDPHTPSVPSAYLPPMHAIFPGWIPRMTYNGSNWAFANPNFSKD